MHTSNYSYIKLFNSIVVGASIMLLVPLFVLADAEDADIVPHDDAAEILEISETSEILTEEALTEEVQVIQTEENEGFFGDGHTDHGHVTPASTIPWWQSTMWWSLFLISLLLMTILSFGVYKYLEE